MSSVKLASFPNRVEAGLAGGLLESNGILHMITGDEVGVFGPGHMWSAVDLLVREEDLAEALELLADAGLLTLGS